MRLNPIGSNQTELHIEKEGKRINVFFSYRTPVACWVVGEGYYRTSRKFSVTTSKHINQWLGNAKAEEKPQEFFDNLVG